jgi:uncharacterized Zn finger protein
MINKGLTLEKTGQWGNESSYSLVNHKKAVLGKLGRADQALQMAWADFKRSPCAYRYQDLMVYVKKTEHKLWHKRAMKAAENQLSGFIEISVLTKEWQSLAERVLAENDEALADISHFTSEPAAKALEKKYPLASAKLYFNMGNRILEAKKSKYYPTGIRNFKSARKLWLQEGDKETWAKAVSTINAKHYRKYSFIHDFNDMAEGKPRKKAISEQKKDRILNYSKESFFKKEKG